MASTKRTKPAAAVDELSAGAADTSRIAWEAPAFAYYEKSWLWIAGATVVGLAFAGVFLWLKDYSALAVAVVGTAVFIQQARKRPDDIRYTVDATGFTAGATVYAWSQLKSFWLIDEPRGGHLYLETTNRLLPIRTVHLANVEPAEVRARLAQHLPERTTRGEELADRFLRFIRF